MNEVNFAKASPRIFFANSIQKFDYKEVIQEDTDEGTVRNSPMNPEGAVKGKRPKKIKLKYRNHGVT